jgi:hypothetical protein
VGKVTSVVAAVTVAFFCLYGDALADGMMLKRHARQVVMHPSACRYGCVMRRPVCPDPYSCYSLYGAYGPYGGRAYWTRYTSAGWYP